MALKIRRGTDAERQTVTLADGEPGWTTDTNILYIGDGVTLGGLPVGGVLSSLDEVGDVNVGTPGPAQDGFALVWDDTAGEYVLAEQITTEVNDLTSSVTWDDIPDANITVSSVTQHEGSINHDNLAGYVAAEHVDWSVTGAEDINVDRITSTAVTQHEAALTITESQISDLGAYLTDAPVDGTTYGRNNGAWTAISAGGAEVNDLTAAVTWANIPDANVPQTAITQHEAALTITESQISDLGSYLTSVQDSNVDSEASLDGQVLTSDGLGNALWETPVSGVTDHTLLSNIGTNTHAQIDTHIADSTTHFTQASIVITESQISDLDHTDSTAIHDNVSGEIALVTEKVTPVSGDFLLIEDSADSNSKKRVQVGNLPGGGGGISNVVEDTTPQLGGDLDANGNDITFSTNLTIKSSDLSNERWLIVDTDNTTQSPQLQVGTGTVPSHMQPGSVSFNLYFDATAGSWKYSGDTAQYGSVFTYSSGAMRWFSTAVTGSGGGNASISKQWQLTRFGTMDMVEVASAATPESGFGSVYVKTDGKIYFKDDAGTEYDLTEVGSGIGNVVEDTTPQLGGDLDVNGNDLVSTSNGDINITPDGTGRTNVSGLDAPMTINSQTGTTYAPVLDDSEKLITLSNAAAITVTIPANASVAYPVGTKLNFMQLGAGQATIAITSDSLNVEAGLTLKLKGQYAVATAIKVATTSWVLFGNLETS